jgi:DNA-binding MarR family transcriptional regulator
MSTILSTYIFSIMKKVHTTPAFYLALLEFLMNSKHYVMEIGADLDLTSVQAVTLLLIDQAYPRPMKSFCTLFHCDASNVTGIMDGLEKKQLVSRQSDPNDRRIKVIHLEPAGKKVQLQIIERLAENDGFLFDQLSEAEAKQFVHIVEKLSPTKKPAQ